MYAKINSLIVGAVLGDGHIQKTQSKTEKCRLRIAHGPLQKQYLYFKYKQLISFCSSEPKFDENNKTYCFYTNYCSEMKKYHDLFYEPIHDKIGLRYRKVIRPELQNFFKDPESLAIWYCDDGSKRVNADACRIATHGYCLESIQCLQWIIKENFNIPTHIVKAGKSIKNKHQWYVLSFAARDGGFLKLRNIIKDYIMYEIPEMEYKIKLLRPRND